MTPRAEHLIARLKEDLGFSGLRLLHEDLRPLSWSKNILLTGQDGGGRRLFIKSGVTEGLYRHEFDYAEAFYRAAPELSAQPLYWRDDEQLRFIASAYVEGTPLDEWMEGGPSAESKGCLLEDLFRIFRAFQACDIIHRDIRPQNFMVCGGRLIIIDFQLAVSHTAYREPDFFRTERGVLGSLGEDFAYGCLMWDDAWSFLKVLEYVGKEALYAARYDDMHAAISAAVGRRIIRYPQRDRQFWTRFYRQSKLLPFISLTAARRNE